MLPQHADHGLPSQTINRRSREETVSTKIWKQVVLGPYGPMMVHESVLMAEEMQTERKKDDIIAHSA